MLDADGIALSTGGGAVLEAGNRRLLHERCFVVHLHLDVPGQLQRLARDRSRPLLQRPDRERVLRELAAIRGPLMPPLPIPDAGGLPRPIALRGSSCADTSRRA